MNPKGLDALSGKESSAMTNNEIATRESNISPETLASLGGGRIAYVRTIRSEDVQKQFPQAPALAPGSLLYALHAADGTPIMLTDSREAAIANAWSQELETVSVH
jgi:hypothetical protein